MDIDLGFVAGLPLLAFPRHRFVPRRVGRRFVLKTRNCVDSLP